MRWRREQETRDERAKHAAEVNDQAVPVQTCTARLKFSPNGMVWFRVQFAPIT